MPFGNAHEMVVEIGPGSSWCGLARCLMGRREPRGMHTPHLSLVPLVLVLHAELYPPRVRIMIDVDVVGHVKLQLTCQTPQVSHHPKLELGLPPSAHPMAP